MSLSRPSPYDAEDESVARELTAQRSARWLKRNAIPQGAGGWLATKMLDWRRFIPAGHARGALTEDVARATLTRDARHRQMQTRKHLRERASRRGHAALVAAIRGKAA